MYNMRISIDYDRSFSDKHRVTAMVMGERQMEQRQVLLATNYLGLAGRVNYGFDNKYFLDFNAAYQGSEQFAKDKRFGFFPSLSAAWILSNESFLEGSEALSFLKLRASVGQVGNDVFAYGSSNRYLYLTTWNTNATEDQLGNPNITWETYTKYNVGFEAELYNSLYLGADYFYHDNRDIMILDIDIIPDGMMGLGGTSYPPANLGELINQGFEIVAGYHKSIGNNFGIAIDGNLSFSTNEQQYMAELPYDDSYAYAYREQGYPVNYFWGYKTDGLFSSQNEIDNWYDQSALGGVPIPGDIKYMDLTGDDIVDQKDLAPLGINANPKMVYGLRAQVNYKWFDLNVFVNGVNNRNVYLSGFGRWSNRDNFTDYMKEAWTPENQDAAYPRLGNNSTNYILSDYWIENGSYLRVKNLELGFTIPESVTSRINASSIRLYVNGLNPFAFDNLPNDDFDPETASGSNINYPIIKSYNFGVSMKF
jgi:TonB-linked SusC/RagA family outer membrane protein